MAVATEKISTNDSSAINNKICGVCGDKALGYNFNAVTCESCKAFFRRNALTTKEFRCPFNEQCEITVITRRFCQKCRLEKCISIGMRKEYIMSEEDKLVKRKKIEQNRAAKKRSSGAYDEDVTSKIKRENSDDSNDGFLKKTNGQVSYTTGTINIVPQQVSITKMRNNSIDANNVSVIINSTSNNSDALAIEADTELKSKIGLPNGYVTHTIAYAGDNLELDNQQIHSPAVIDTYHIEQQNSVESDTANDTVLRTILTPATNGTILTNMEEAPLLSELINNEAQCSNQLSHLKTAEQRNLQIVTDVTRDVLQDVQRIPIEPNSIESILCEAIKLEYEAYSSLAQAHNNSRGLNDAERAKLNELIVANKALLAPLDEDITNLVAEDCRFKSTSPRNDPVLLDIINLTAIAIRRLIKMAKKINAFKNMCQEDQVALLKGGCTEMMILRSAMTYDHTKESWKIPHSQESMSRIKVDVLKQAKGNIYQEHERFIKTFDARWRMDENIILIMCAITLFTPDRPRVIHHDVIKLEQNSYYYLLRRYLESVYPGCEARSTFLKLIQKISELHKLNEEVISVYLDVNPSDVEPLLIEIFDLKPH